MRALEKKWLGRGDFISYRLGGIGQISRKTRLKRNRFASSRIGLDLILALLTVATFADTQREQVQERSIGRSVPTETVMTHDSETVAGIATFHLRRRADSDDVPEVPNGTF
jgi:hypothetical protein